MTLPWPGQARLLEALPRQEIAPQWPVVPVPLSRVAPPALPPGGQLLLPWALPLRANDARWAWQPPMSLTAREIPTLRLASLPLASPCPLMPWRGAWSRSFARQPPRPPPHLPPHLPPRPPGAASPAPHPWARVDLPAQLVLVPNQAALRCRAVAVVAVSALRHLHALPRRATRGLLLPPAVPRPRRQCRPLLLPCPVQLPHQSARAEGAWARALLRRQPMRRARLAQGRWWPRWRRWGEGCSWSRRGCCSGASCPHAHSGRRRSSGRRRWYVRAHVRTCWGACSPSRWARPEQTQIHTAWCELMARRDALHSARVRLERERHTQALHQALRRQASVRPATAATTASATHTHKRKHTHAHARALTWASHASAARGGGGAARTARGLPRASRHAGLRAHAHAAVAALPRCAGGCGAGDCGAGARRVSARTHHQRDR